MRLSSEAIHCLYSNLGYFVGPLTSTHNRLPPAPLELRPYGALQICLLLLLLLLYVLCSMITYVEFCLCILSIAPLSFDCARNLYHACFQCRAA